MRLPIALGLAVASLFLGARNADADVILSVTTTADLGNLTVGQTVTFDVVLSGLAAAESLDFLGVTLDYDSAFLGAPAVTPGLIVPDVSGFVSGSPPTAGFVTAFYDNLLTGTAPITDNGTFFSFSVTVLAPGVGTISFTSIDAIDPNGSSVAGTAAGGPLTFSATDAQPVPEPGLLLSMTLLVGASLAGGRFRRGRA